MTNGKKTTVSFKKDEIEKLSNNKPVVYKIFNDKDENIYTGIAKRGRVIGRLEEHLTGGPDPIHGGKKVQIEQMTSIDDARKKESNIISRTKPRDNKQGK